MNGVHHDLERGLSITNMIGEYAKVSELQAGENIFDLIALFQGYEARYAREFDNHGIQFFVSGPKTILLRADGTHMNSIFSNLINNARDALIEENIDMKEIKVIIEDHSQGDGHKVIVKVQDNGPGIPEGQLEEIFEPFFSTKPTSGTGLGLGIVKRLIKLYEGQLEIESKVNQGTCFTISFPGVV